MAKVEKEPSHPKKERPALGEVIRTWAVLISAVVVMALGIGQGISYVVKSEIDPLRQNVASLERRFDTFEGRLAESDRRIDKLKTEVELNSLKLRFVLEALSRMERKLDARLSQDGDGSEEQPRASLSKLDEDPVIRSVSTKCSYSG